MVNSVPSSGFSMNEDARINYIELPADDFDRIKAFYRDVFGWTFQDFGENYLAFNDGRMDGGFYRSPRQSDYAQGAALVILYAEDLESMRDRITAAGGQLCRPIFSFPGGRRFHFRDPSHNELAVWSDR